MITALIAMVLALVFPPAAVVIISGCNADLCINIVLTLCGFLPGQVHALFVIFVYYKNRDDRRAGIAPTYTPGVYGSRLQAGGLKSSNQPAQYPTTQPGQAARQSYVAPVYAHEQHYTNVTAAAGPANGGRQANGDERPPSYHSSVLAPVPQGVAVGAGSAAGKS